MRQVPYWVDANPRPKGLTSDLPGECDVLIVGSGLTGLSAAIRLAENGKSVLVVEQGEIASGASSMNGGMVSPDVKGGVDSVYDAYGPEIGRQMWDASVRSIEIVVDHSRKYGLDSRIVRGGMTGLSTRKSDLKSIERDVRWYREQFGVDWEVVGPDRIGELVGNTDVFQAAFYEPEGFGVQPAGLVFGMAQACSRAGVALVEGTRVVGVSREGAGFQVTTTAGVVRAGAVIVATNGYTTSEPIPALARKIVSVGSYIIVTEPLTGAEAESIFPTNTMSYTRRRLLNYMRRTPDDRILLGGRRNLRPDLDLRQSARDLQRRLVEFWPSLGDKEITHVWGGRLAVAFDLLPHIGQIDGVWYALGYAGHGVGLSMLLGHELAGMLLGKDPPSVFSRINHRGRPYYWGNPWFLTPASALYRTLDKLGM